MDRENLVKLKTLIDLIIHGNPPNDEELDYDDKAIGMYHYMVKLQKAMEEYGF